MISKPSCRITIASSSSLSILPISPVSSTTPNPRVPQASVCIIATSFQQLLDLVLLILRIWLRNHNRKQSFIVNAVETRFPHRSSQH